jgi:hypothetical protein
MGLSISSLIVPAALFLGTPHGPTLGAYEQGLYCDTVELVQFVVELADQGGDPQQAVREINKSLDRRACLYTTRGEVLTEIIKFERPISANHTTYGIYQVLVGGIGHQTTEIGDLTWKFSQPLVMYTLRKAPAEKSASH